MGEVIKRYKDGKFLGFYLRWYEGGKRRMLASKQATHAEARRMLLEIESRAARGEMGIVRRPPSPPLVELQERFLAEYSRPRIKDPGRYRQNARIALQRVVPLLEKRADQVTTSDVAKAREALRRRYAPASVKLSLNFLSTLYAWAVREELAPINPCRGVERPLTEQSVDFLTREEVRRLIDAAEAGATSPMKRMLHLCIVLAVHTGLRKGELLGLRWQDLDIESRRLTVARSYESTPKSGKARHLRLPATIVPLLTQWQHECPRSAQGCVFPIGRKSGSVAGAAAMLGLPRLMESIGLRKFAHPWHLLRHSMASHYVMAGGNILALQRILGHSDLKMTLVYAHLAPDFLENELDKIRF
jgi:integrase